MNDCQIKIQRTKQLAIKGDQIIKEYSSRIKKEKMEALSYFRKIRSTVEKNSGYKS